MPTFRRRNILHILMNIREAINAANVASPFPSWLCCAFTQELAAPGKNHRPRLPQRESRGPWTGGATRWHATLAYWPLAGAPSRRPSM
jgi:hypothetical protein